MSLTTQDKKIIRFCKVVRDSFMDARTIYTFGSCYNFHLILKEVFGDATPYLLDSGDHIVSKIGDKYFDIDGWVEDDVVKIRKNEMTEEEKILWEANSSGLRAEWMIKKRDKTYI